MNLDGLTLSVLVRELNNSIVPGQIQKVWQIDKHSIVFRIHNDKGQQNLVITVGSNPSIYLAKHILDIPKEPTSLMMFLRKHLEGARLTEITQIHGDRIICIHADKLELDGSITSNQIYVELMGKYSNCIFTQNNSILDSLIHVNPLMNRVRSVGPKQSYELPPNTERGSLFEFSQDEIRDLLTTFKQDTIMQTVRHIFNGFGPVLMDYILYLLKEQLSTKELHSTAITEDTRRNILTTKSLGNNVLTDELILPLSNSLYRLQQELLNATGLYVYKKETGKTFISPLSIDIYMHTLDAKRISAFTSISEAIENDISKSGGLFTASKELEKRVASAIKKEIGRNEKIRLELQDTSKSDMYKAYGDLLMIYSYLPNGYDSEITISNVLISPPEDITIPLDPALSIVENAQAYYKLYTKMKNRMENGKYQLNQSTIRIQYLESIQYSLSIATTKEEVQMIHLECENAGIVKKNKKPIPFKIRKDNFLHFTIPDGDVYIGRNNEQNEYLTHRWAKPKDLWLHTQQLQGSHVILRTTIEPTIQMIEQAASYAAYFSKGKNTSKVTVDYTLIKNIKKPPGTPPGYVIFSTHNDIVVEPKKPPEYEELNS